MLEFQLRGVKEVPVKPYRLLLGAPTTFG